MVSATHILNIARAEIGYKESPKNSNKTKYGAWYGLNGYAWCVIFIQWIFAQAGASDLLPVKTASCSALMNAAKQDGLWVTKDYQPGDILIYDFPGNAVKTDHCGILETTGRGGVLTAIEGNTGIGDDADGGAVMRRTRKVSLVYGAVRPKYTAEKSSALVAQEVLDGKYGNGDMRKNALTAAGYNPSDVQKIVNALVNGTYRVMVTAPSGLNIREGPGTNYDRLDGLMCGAVVPIDEVREGRGADAWGRVGNGWISLDHTAVI